MTKGKFSLTDLLNSNSKSPEIARETGNFEIKMISVHELIQSGSNFYSISDIEDLKDSIEMLGVKQNLIIKPITEGPFLGKYEVIAGHRRRAAVLKLVEEGRTEFEFVPCRVESNLDEIEKKIMIIYTNSTARELNEWEKIEQVNRLKELLKEYKKTHDLPGRIRELLADTFNLSATQVGRMETIHDNLIPEYKEELKQGTVGISTAAEISTMPLADQKAVYQKHVEEGQTSIKTVRQIKSETKKQEPPLPTSPEPEPEKQQIRLGELQELLNSLVRIRAQYNSLMDIPAGERALKALETLNALIYDDIEEIKASVLGETLFTENGGGA